MHLNDMAKLMRTAGDGSRLKILCVLFKERKLCVSDISERLKMSVAIISHHLQVMATEGLVEPIREGKRVCYRVSGKTAVKDLKKFICKYIN